MRDLAKLIDHFDPGNLTGSRTDQVQWSQLHLDNYVYRRTTELKLRSVMVTTALDLMSNDCRFDPGLEVALGNFSLIPET